MSNLLVTENVTYDDVIKFIRNNKQIAEIKNINEEDENRITEWDVYKSGNVYIITNLTLHHSSETYWIGYFSKELKEGDKPIQGKFESKKGPVYFIPHNPNGYAELNYMFGCYYENGHKYFDEEFVIGKRKKLLKEKLSTL